MTAEPLPATRKGLLTGVIGGRLIGTDPYDVRSWSGISRYFFRECQSQELLKRAYGADISKWKARLLMLKNLHPDRNVWRQQYYLDPAYRRALTAAVAAKLTAEDRAGPLLQIGALFNLPSLVKDETPVYSYHDGNLALRVQNKVAVRGLSKRVIEKAWAYEKNLYHGLTHIFTMSEYLRQTFVHDFEVPPGRVTCIGAGVNIDNAPESPDWSLRNGHEILFIGIEFERKGGLVLLEAFQKIRSAFPDAVLHVVGPRHAAPGGSSMEGVQWHGFLNKERAADRLKLDELFKRSSLFVLPSLYEPFGIAPAEAMMHGMPAVVSGDWALAETVIRGKTGLHAKPGCPSSLAEAILQLLGDPERLKQMGRDARTHALNNFQWSGVVSKLGAHLA